MSGLRLYGIVRADAELPKVSQPKLDKVVWQDIATVVSGPDERELTEDDAATHLDVLCALVRGGPVIPLRFGTVAPDRDAVAEEVLRPTYDEFAAMLDGVEGVVELRVDFEFDEAALLREVVAERPDLRHRVAGGQRDVAERVEAGQEVFEQVAAHARARGDAAIEPLLRMAKSSQRLESKEPATDRWALLVDASEVDTFDEVMAGMSRDTRDARVSYWGPLPVFNFLTGATAAPQQQQQSSQWGW